MLNLDALLGISLSNRRIDLFQFVQGHIGVQAVHLLELLQRRHAQRPQDLPL